MSSVKDFVTTVSRTKEEGRPGVSWGLPVLLETGRGFDDLENDPVCKSGTGPGAGGSVDPEETDKDAATAPLAAVNPRTH